MNQTSKPTMSARLGAVKILTHILHQQGSLTSLLSRFSHEVAPEHEALLKELCFGVCRWYPKLNSIALYLLKHPFEEKDQDLYAILLIALYQLEYMQTPDHAAVNEAVANCKTLDKGWSAAIMNAVLRRYLREKTAIEHSLLEIPAFQFNHPKWFLKRIQKAWPLSFDDVIHANNRHPPMCLRVNSRHVSRETMQKILSDNGIETYKSPFSESGLYLEKAVRVSELPDFFNGYVSVQDEAAQLAAQILSPQPGERILDACAAPGGKTGHLLEMADIALTAIELEPWRLEKIQQNLNRLKVTATLICADAANIDQWWDKQLFDKVLLDVPCSATGVIRRNPDVKINRKPADIDALVQIQSRLLKQVWQTLKPGGLLLYATCSVLPDENSHQIAMFLATTPDARDIKLPLVESCGLEVTHGRQLLPQNEGHDGFYYCLLQKQS